MTNAPFASLLLCTIDRFDLTVRCVGEALRTAEFPFELLTVDNGSTDRRVIDYVAGLNPAYHRLNPDNQGIARMLNQMLLRAKGDYLCVIDNDILLPAGWLRKLAEANRAIPGSGISGIHCVEKLSPAVEEHGCEVHFQEGVFGTKFFSRAWLDKVGYFTEAFHPYGCEDSEMSHRSNMAGFRNYYLGRGDRARHLGHDVSEKTRYRQMKWASLRNVTQKVLSERMEYFRQTGDYYVPPPPMH